ncbi:hypothetical protein [Kitasatospora sp. NPDC087315]|uniref:hypothetical protein n=1 Tax=Kitasatospora sp. NPDC087315 TaxID=3364069 RepID=UPI00380ACB87
MRRSADDQLRRRVPADIAAGLPGRPARADPDELLKRVYPVGASRGAWRRRPDGTEVFVEGFERALRRETVLRRLEDGRRLRRYRGLA